jgi:nitrate reductase NapAB chaperone NapD
MDPSHIVVNLVRVMFDVDGKDSPESHRRASGSTLGGGVFRSSWHLRPITLQSQRRITMVSAFVFIQMSPSGGWDEMSALHNALHAIGGVKTVHFVAGPTDIIVFAEGADQAALAETLGKIRGVKGVGSTDTRLVWPV